MVQLTVEQRMFLMRSYLRGNTLQQTRVLFRQRFPERNHPTGQQYLKTYENIMLPQIFVARHLEYKWPTILLTRH